MSIRDRPFTHLSERVGANQVLMGSWKRRDLTPLPVISVASARICCEGGRRVVFQAGPTEGVLKSLQDRPHGYKER